MFHLGARNRDSTGHEDHLFLVNTTASIVFDGTGRLLKPGLHEVARVQPQQGAGLVFFKAYSTELSPASDVHVVDKLPYPAAQHGLIGRLRRVNRTMLARQ